MRETKLILHEMATNGDSSLYLLFWSSIALTVSKCKKSIRKASRRSMRNVSFQSIRKSVRKNPRSIQIKAVHELQISLFSAKRVKKGPQIRLSSQKKLICYIDQQANFLSSPWCCLRARFVKCARELSSLFKSS